MNKVHQVERLHVTGFDSAWGGAQRGAMCDLWIDKASGEVHIDTPPLNVSWPEAIERVQEYARLHHHVMAVDQGLIVPNDSGMRPVERILAAALGHMGCSAYPSNRSNDSCYGPAAGIWGFLSRLDASGYVHRPMMIPQSTTGRYYFECYPHPAILAVMKKTSVFKYKCRHGNREAWDELIEYLSGLPIRNLPETLEGLRAQSKANEDKLDAVVCAYTAVLWWQHGTAHSSMLGDMQTGYIVTPHNDLTIKLLKSAFGTRMNHDRGDPPTHPSPTVAPTPSPSLSVAESGFGDSAHRTENGWSKPVDLIATDTTNLWRNRKGRTANAWMNPIYFDGYRLIVKFLEEDAEPEVEFGPFRGSDVQMGFMRNDETQPGLWTMLVAGASKDHPLRFPIVYRYEPML